MPRVVRSPRVVVVGEGSAAEVARLVRSARAEVVEVRAPWARVVRLAVVARLLGARAVVALPTDGPGAPRRLDRLVERIVLPSQDVARAWVAAGFPLGRLVVVPAGEHAAEALAAVHVEVAEMARRR